MKIGKENWSRSVLAVVLLLASAAVHRAEPPPLVRYQARLVDAAGVPILGLHDLTFQIFDQETGGLSLWAEAWAGVDLGSGSVDLMLGASSPLDSSVLAAPNRWLEVTVDGAALMPRQRLSSVPFAMVTDRLGTLTLAEVQADVDSRIGVHAGDTGAHHPPATLDSGYDQGGSGQGRTITADSGAVNIDGPSGLTVSGNVGVGTSSPQGALHLSAGTGSVELLIEADPADANETHQPSMKFSQDGGVTTGQIGYFNSSNALTVKSVSNNGLRLGTNDTDRLTIQADGDVGIGTTSPGRKLDVNGDMRANTVVLGQALGSGATPAAHSIYRDNLTRAWARTNADGNLMDGFNLTVIKKQDLPGGLTRYEYSFRRAMANANYAVTATPTDDLVAFRVNQITTAGFVVKFWPLSSTIPESEGHSVIVIGG